MERIITDKGQCRPILEWKGFDWKTATLEDRIEFCLSDVGEAGMDHFDLRALAAGLDSFAPKPIVIVETGLGWGFSTRLFLTYILKYGGELNTIDIMARKGIVDPLEALGLWKHVNYINYDSRQINWPFNKYIDYLNLDSEHALSFALGEYMRFRAVLLDHQSIVGFHDTDVCYGVKRALDMIEEVDVLRPFAKAENMGGAGYKSFHIIQHDRNDKDWNSRSRI